MGLFIVCLLISCLLTPLAINLFWLFIAVMPFVALYNGESANLVLILFCLSAVLIQNEFRFLYVIGAVTTIVFMVLSAVAVAAFNYVISHPDQIAITAAGVLAIVVLFIPRKPLVEVNERQPHENDQQLALTYDPRFGFRAPRLIGQGSEPPRSQKSSISPLAKIFGMFARLRRRFSRPLRAGDLVVCVMPCGDLAEGLYNVKSRNNGFVQVWGIDGGWKIDRFKRWAP